MPLCCTWSGESKVTLTEVPATSVKSASSAETTSARRPNLVPL